MKARDGEMWRDTVTQPAAPSAKMKQILIKFGLSKRQLEPITLVKPKHLAQIKDTPRKKSSYDFSV